MSSTGPELWVVRHGETEWSRDGRHTSVTDLDLTPEGERVAAALAPRLAGTAFDLVLSSPRARARRTAELLGVLAAGAPVGPHRPARHRLADLRGADPLVVAVGPLDEVVVDLRVGEARQLGRTRA